MTYGILVDVTRCTGCEKCIAACIQDHHGSPEKAEVDRLTSRDGLSANRLATIAKVDEGRFARKSCMHCLEPSCVSACLVGGITKSAEGPVIYDPAKCIGCRYCMLACPFHIPRYEWDRTVPFMRKCDMCYSRVQENLPPACVEACPNQALTFGERSSLVQLAHQRIGSGYSRYLPHVWGEEEFGGTSVLYISDVDLSSLDWPATSFHPIPELTESLIESTPFIGLGVCSSLLGINWVIRRRMKLERECKAPNPEPVTPDPESTDHG
jgi:formate dehydrogenase iron-sulfur subunit